MTILPSTSIAFVHAALRRDAEAGGAAEAAAAVRDWSAVLRLAQEQDVVWWVARALPASAPDEVHGAIAESMRAQALGALAGAQQLLSLMTVMREAGIRAAAYKGPSLAIDLHGDLTARRFCDLDILVARRDIDRALRAIGDAGYAQPPGLTERAEHFYSRWEGVMHRVRGDGLPVELHWRCLAARYGGPGDPEALLARTRACSLGGSRVEVPDQTDLAVLLALHGVKHAWRLLLWVVDYSAAVDRPDFDWDAYLARARGWGVRRAVLYAALVAQAIAGVPLPRRVEVAARGDRAAVLLAAAIVARHREARATDIVGGDSEPRYDLRWQDGVLAKLRYLALAAALPTPRDLDAVHLPDRWLLLSYAVRAYRLMWHAMGRRSG
ncbi:MAG: nucleotidyltransferase family protein [Gemmatimonadetes bacterium]|nr:nucleotidyltransferase family protein [Gemmatimonadota bacterium]